MAPPSSARHARVGKDGESLRAAAARRPPARGGAIRGRRARRGGHSRRDGGGDGDARRRCRLSSRLWRAAAAGAGAPFEVADIDDVAAQAIGCSPRGDAAAAAATSSLRPAAANVWAENTRDEAMRSELESLFERAAEDAEAAEEDAEEERAEAKERERAAREAGGGDRVRHRVGPRPRRSRRPAAAPRARLLRVGIDRDMSRLTDAMARLESAVERKERERRRAPRGRAGRASDVDVQVGRADSIPGGPRRGATADARERLCTPRRCPARGAVPSSLIRATGGYGAVGGWRRPRETRIGLWRHPRRREGQLKVSCWRGSRPGVAAAGSAGVADAVAPAEREQAVRELRERREMIDSRRGRLEEVLAKIAPAEAKENNLAKNGGGEGVDAPREAGSSNNTESPASGSRLPRPSRRSRPPIEAARLTRPRLAGISKVKPDGQAGPPRRGSPSRRPVVEVTAPSEVERPGRGEQRWRPR